ncbi:MAG: DNA-3-methyladenine glycosylase family protein [Anaerovoracaceae bacterium]|jgi:N-glycosylase/DNA lyase
MNRYIPDINVKTIMDSGQCFRLIRENAKAPDKPRYKLIAGDRLLYIEELGEGYYDFDCTEEDFENIWIPYFDLEEDYDRFSNSIDEGDIFLAAAANFGRGMKILRQDPWETLISFILSQQKNIPAIRRGVETLCERYGRRIGPSEFAFPDPWSLIEAGVEGLKSCGIGFRAKYVYDAAVKVEEGKLNLAALEELENSELKDELKGIYGVGDKIAACVMLFSYHRLDMFPIDVWMNRVLKKHYPDGFPFDRYSSYSGVLQQYLFYYALNGGLEG